MLKHDLLPAQTPNKSRAVQSTWALRDATPPGIVFSMVVLGIASLNLLLFLTFFEKTDEFKAPEHMEWFARMSLLITFVWIYIEILRLLSKL